MSSRWTATAGSAKSDREVGDHRGVIARTDLALDGAGGDLLEERAAGEHVVEAPADVPLPHVAPRRPPREHLVVVRRERPAAVDEQAAADDALELIALL